MGDRAVPVSLGLRMRLAAARDAFAVEILLDDRVPLLIDLLVDVHFPAIGVGLGATIVVVVDMPGTGTGAIGTGGVTIVPGGGGGAGG